MTTDAPNPLPSAENDAGIESGTVCDWPGCGLLAVALVANGEPLTSPEYAERYACRWHQRNSVFPPAKGNGS